jgi:hypothetical protein
MSLTLKLFAILTVISRWVEDLRVGILAHIWGIANDEKPPVPWREREGLPSHNHWPMKKSSISGSEFPIWLTGKVKVGKVRPVPAKLESNLDSTTKESK